MSSDKKSSILGFNMLNYISNFASRTLSSPNSEASKSADESVKSPESDREKIEHLNSKKQEIDQFLLSNFDQDLKLTKQTGLEKNTELKNKENDFTFKLLSKAETEYLNSPLGKSNITKGCKWSPDGSCIITNSEDTTLRIFDLNNDMLNKDETSVKELYPSLRMTEPEIIYDYAWYPLMNSNDPITACIFSTCKDNPIHLYDAYTGQIRCSYKGYNHLDELISAYSIAFDSSGYKMYCGYNKCLKIFDISVPGRNYQNVPLYGDQYKLPGIISCIAFSKAQCGVYAVGSYTKYIGIYIESTNEPVCLIQTHTGGLTHLMFSSDGNKLFSGARKDSDIYCWDMRNPGKLLQIFKRDVKTNQRIYFDLYGDCKYLASGNTNGTVKFWNAYDFDITKEYEPVLASFEAHSDCVNGINFHPTMNLLATCSGQRKLFNLKSNINVELSSTDSDEETENVVAENSLKIWKHFL